MPILQTQKTFEATTPEKLDSLVNAYLTSLNLQLPQGILWNIEFWAPSPGSQNFTCVIIAQPGTEGAPVLPPGLGQQNQVFF